MDNQNAASYGLNLYLGQHQHHCLMMMNKRQTTQSMRVTQRIVLKMTQIWKMKMLNILIRVKCTWNYLRSHPKKKHKKKSLSTYSDNKCSPSHSHIDSSHTTAVNHPEDALRVKSLEGKVKDDIVVSTSTPRNQRLKKNLRQQSPNIVRRSKKIKRSKHEVTQTSKMKPHMIKLSSKVPRNASKARSPKKTFHPKPAGAIMLM